MKILFLIVVIAQITSGYARRHGGHSGKGNVNRPIGSRSNMPIVSLELKSLTRSVNHIKSIINEAEEELKAIEMSSEKKGLVTFLPQESFKSVVEKFESACSKLQDIRAKANGWTSPYYRSERLSELSQSPSARNIGYDPQILAKLEHMEEHDIDINKIPALNLQAIAGLLSIIKNPCNTYTNEKPLSQLTILVNGIVQNTCPLIAILLAAAVDGIPTPEVPLGDKTEGDSGQGAGVAEGSNQPPQLRMDLGNLVGNQVKTGKGNSVLVIPLYFIGANSPDAIFNPEQKSTEGKKPTYPEHPGKVTIQDIEHHLNQGVLGKLTGKPSSGEIQQQTIQFTPTEWGPTFTGLINGFLNQASNSKETPDNIKMNSKEEKGFVLALIVQPEVKENPKGQEKSSMDGDLNKSVRFVPLFWPWDNPLKNVGPFSTNSETDSNGSGATHSANSPPGTQNSVSAMTMTDSSSMTVTSLGNSQPPKA